MKFSSNVPRSQSSHCGEKRNTLEQFLVFDIPSLIAGVDIEVSFKCLFSQQFNINVVKYPSLSQKTKLQMGRWTYHLKHTMAIENL